MTVLIKERMAHRHTQREGDVRHREKRIIYLQDKSQKK